MPNGLNKRDEAKKNKKLTKLNEKTCVDTVRKTTLGIKNELLIDTWIKGVRSKGIAISNSDIKKNY